MILLNNRKEVQILACHEKLSLEIVYNEKDERIPTDKEKIMIAWNDHLKQNPNDFDGEMISLKKIVSYRDNEYKLFTRKCSFSDFFATQEERKGVELNLNSNNLDLNFPLPLSFGLVTKTAPDKQNPEGCIVSAIRGDTAFDTGNVTFLPGGYLSPDDSLPYAKINGRKIIGLENGVQREINEELPNVHCEKINFHAVIHSLTESCQPLISGSMEISETVKEVLDLSRGNLEQEIKKLFFIPANKKALSMYAFSSKICVHDKWKLLTHPLFQTKHKRD